MVQEWCQRAVSGCAIGSGRGRRGRQGDLDRMEDFSWQIDQIKQLTVTVDKQRNGLRSLMRIADAAFQFPTGAENALISRS